MERKREEIVIELNLITFSSIERMAPRRLRASIKGPPGNTLAYDCSLITSLTDSYRVLHVAVGRKRLEERRGKQMAQTNNS